MCLYPRLITNRKYTATKKNGGVIPPMVDKRVETVPVGCGRCMECRKQKVREWQVRLHEEVRNDKTGQFVTLSFSDESIVELEEAIENNVVADHETGEILELKGYELDNAVATIGVRRYLERWRKRYGRSVKHWLVTELGHTKTERIHIHGVIWTEENKETISEIWKYGNVWVGDYVNEKTINYIVKYIGKADKVHKEYKSKILTSAGIGKGYMKRLDSSGNKYKKEGTNEAYRTREGIKMAMPIYYRNKIYNDEEKEKLWIEKLDKEERWINGIRISIKEGEEIYYKRLAEARIKNKRLGYGDNKIDWNRKRYEQERRNIKKIERDKKVKRKKR